MTTNSDHCLVRNFVLHTFCATCNEDVSGEIVILGGAGMLFRDLSLLSKNPHIRVSQDRLGRPLYTHKSCNSPLIVQQAKPISEWCWLDNTETKEERAQLVPFLFYQDNGSEYS